jgi:hypothetical protein
MRVSRHDRECTRIIYISQESSDANELNLHSSSILFAICILSFDLLVYLIRKEFVTLNHATVHTLCSENFYNGLELYCTVLYRCQRIKESTEQI